ncbi:MULTISPECIES: hypothetical protein [unclassified Candidatus Frackibacter]|uniref:hypothetical protein n=1 Tax=unclassified Candidatus Frackibacter TaxID=2648818 RepID=UPI00088F5FDD|nr:MULTISPECIES: hypothetical protein [unclassified Candidatus Frackibacter]SDC76415.1 hypothetical protein SAMN04515661_12353 [Candidatus Frackibacter sp. WG11]SEM89854.1 hypothetical protein SAMN04488698_12352 [Candidatus Frackibacter sp. WG12]SFL99326.1 hypothetical protein SAMN04488699_12452 [Candidatus Frackibacter sp. WG13]
MKKQSKFKFVFKLYLIRGILSGILAYIYIGIKDGGLFTVSYYGLGNIAVVLMFSLPLFFLVTFMIFVLENTIITSFREGLSSIIIFILCISLLLLRSYFTGRLVRILPILSFFIGFATLAIILERLFGLQHNGNYYFKSK